MTTDDILHIVSERAGQRRKVFLTDCAADLGQVITVMSESLGMSTQELASLTNCTPERVDELVVGAQFSSITREEFEALAKALGYEAQRLAMLVGLQMQDFGTYYRS